MRKKMLLFGTLVGVVSLSLSWRFMSFDGINVTSAQTSDAEYQKLLERDKTVPKEKVEKAYAEAKKIQDDILAVMTKGKPNFKLERVSAGHLKYSVNPGQRGTTSNEISWQTKKTRISLTINLELNNENAIKIFRHSIEGISMGDFFAIPDIGNEAILVKNVSFNTRMTNVGFHFVKGRAIVSIYVADHKRKTEKNEKELMEIVRLIEPLILARPNFDD